MLTRTQLLELRRAKADPNRLRAAMALTTPPTTQVQIAKALGCTQPKVSRLVKGQYSSMSLDTSRALARLFGCEVDDLFPSREAVAS
jgi:predicted XRE-type DNA-binding protein